MRLTDFKALSFDCYGTLIDWETGMIEAVTPLTRKARTPLSRDQILAAHARHESEQQAQTPTKRYSELLAVVYKRMAEQWGIATTVDECDAYGLSVRDWPAFSDTVAALQYLKTHYKLIVLSNVDNRTFSFTNAKLQVAFDAIYTAEDVGAYKPSPENFTYLLSHIGDLGIEKRDLLHTAESLFHDHAPANRLGLASCWIHRRHAQQGFGATRDPEAMPTVDFKFNSMADLVRAHQNEWAAR
jgi:2-haloacid dehalogenase